MLISTKGRYALRVMVDLSEHQTGDYVPLQEIADRQQISKEYLNSILKELVKHHLLISLRGHGGGYQLIKSPDAYSIDEILQAAEEDIAPVPCAGGAYCPHAANCKSLPMWMKLDKMIHDFFSGITLADLMDNGQHTDILKDE